jgi:UDP-N-acetylmuramoylalanine--D-glutamate ligase
LVASEETGNATRRFVDDGLATSVLPVIAALGVFSDEPIALIAGGYDRGVEYAPLAEAIAARTRLTVLITMGEAGQRIGEAVTRRSSDIPQIRVTSMRAAVTEARSALSDGGVVLLSPAAPSFDQYKNWKERSDDFTAIVLDLTGT